MYLHLEICFIVCGLMSHIKMRRLKLFIMLKKITLSSSRFHNVKSFYRN